ncbi:MAG: carboxypeptidase regulatory-like domain-containing protein [Gelidibacter sp.]|nr:carboxypeptidase regulatory-like domain-containing protein [Gelidibacter sp.]
MNQTKTVLSILLLFLIATQISFAGNPIPGIGIVVKRNPGGGQIKIITGSDGGFSTQLQEGEYELSVSQVQLQSSVNGIIKSNYPNSSYRYNGSGIQIIIESSATSYKSKAADGRTYSIVITVPKGGATLSGKMNWDDTVMKNQEISCPDGFVMYNGKCVPIRTQGKLKGKVTKSGNEGMLTEISCPDGFVMSNGECVPIVAAISKPIPGVGIVVKSNKPAINVSFSGNVGSSSSDSISNKSSFNPNLGLEIIWKNFGIGLDAGTFSTKPHFDFDGYAAPLQNLDFIKITNTKSNWTSTYILFGPQYSFDLNAAKNKLVFTASLKGGLTINSAPNFSVTDNNTPPKSNAAYFAPQEYKKNAFTLKPSVTFTYWLNENFAANVNAQYLTQTGQKEFSTSYTDLSKVEFNLESQKVQGQINAAPKLVTNTKGPDKYMSFGLGLTYSFRKGWDGSIKGGKTDRQMQANINTSRGNIKKIKIDEHPDTTTQEESEATDESLRKGINENGLKKNEADSSSKATARKGWDGTVKGGSIVQEESGTSDESLKKGIKEGGLKKNEADTSSKATARKGWDGSIKGGNITQSEIKAIAETLVNLTKKDWEDSANNENRTKAEVKAIAETLVNLTKKGWDGSVKGGNIIQTEIKAIAETLVNLTKKGWDGSANNENRIQSEIKAIAETLVNLTKKNWGDSAKGLRGIDKKDIRRGIKEDGVSGKKNSISAPSAERSIKEKGVAVKGGIRKNEADTSLKATARKGWDGTVKGGSIVQEESGTSDESLKKGITEGGLKKNEADTSSKATARKGWDGSVKGGKMSKADSGIVNNESTIVTRKNEVSLSNLVKITIKYSGEKTNEGTPIVVGNFVTGTISNMPKGTKIKILQSYSGDEGSAITDEKGNFSIILNHDTLHTIYVNDEEYGSIKIEAVNK